MELPEKVRMSGLDLNGRTRPTIGIIPRGQCAGDNRYHSIFGAAAGAERRCAGHCPAHTNIPECLRHARKGNMAEAAKAVADD